MRATSPQAARTRTAVMNNLAGQSMIHHAAPGRAVLPRSLAGLICEPIRIPVFDTAQNIGGESLSDPVFCASLSAKVRHMALRAALRRVDQIKRDALAPHTEWALSWCPLGMKPGWLGGGRFESLWATLRLPTDPQEVFSHPPSALMMGRRISGARLVQMVHGIEGIYGAPHTAAEPTGDGALRRIARTLGQLQELGEPSFDDFLLNEKLAPLREHGDSVSQALETWGRRAGGVTLDSPEGGALIALEAALGATAMDELRAYAEAAVGRAYARTTAELRARNIAVVEQRYSGGDDAGMTLQEIGDRYGITRERVRQLEDKCSEHAQGEPVWAPAAIRVAARLRHLSPCPEKLFQEDPAIRAQTGGAFSARAFLHWAARLGIDCAGLTVASFKASPDRAICADDQRRFMEVVGSVALSICTADGALHLSSLTGQVSTAMGKGYMESEVARALECARGFSWINQTLGWATVECGRTALGTAIRKVLAALPGEAFIPVEDIYAGCYRDARMLYIGRGQRRPIPLWAFTELCLRDADLEVRQGTRFRLAKRDDGPVSEHLSDLESMIVAFMAARGGVAARFELLESVVNERQACSLAALGFVLSYGPFVRNVAHGVYQLRGWELRPADLARAIAIAPGGARRGDAAVDLDEDSCSFGYTIGLAVFSGQTISIPKAAWPFFDGQENNHYRAPDHADLELRVRPHSAGGHCLRGMAAIARLRGWVVGDRIELRFAIDGTVALSPAPPASPA